VDSDSERQEALRRAEQVFHIPKRSVADMPAPTSSPLSVPGEEGTVGENVMTDAPTPRDDISILESSPS
jgi:hypothetical protein